MSEIRVLPPALASQIAAGEVVERPASALKELLENALDADATRCDVEITGGGISLMRVRDNGRGIAEADVPLCVARHATSKLRAFDDLSSLCSFGFRGEALPSIASVSRFVLTTRRAEADGGWRLSVEGGSEPKLEPTGVAPGTTVEVRDLFFNVPARRKFLRSSGTESGHITDVLEAAAFSQPGVSFTLIRDGRKCREWLRVGSREERVRELLGEEALLRVVGERGPLRVEAFLAPPARARNGAAGLRLMLNGRPIKDRALAASVAQAYGGALERGRYPRGAVYLELPPQLADVNVHPQKTEVRFADPRAANDALYQILAGEIARAFSLPPPPRHAWGAPAGERSPFKSNASPPQRKAGHSSPPSAAPSGTPAFDRVQMRIPENPRDASPDATPPERATGHAGMGGKPLRVADSPTRGALATSLRATPAGGSHAAAPAGGSIPAAAGTHRAGNALWPASHDLSSDPAPSSTTRNTELVGEPSASPAPGERRPSSVAHATDRSPDQRAAAHHSSEPAHAEPAEERLRFVGKLRTGHWIAEGARGVYAIEPHAARELIAMSELEAQLGTGAVPSQPLLFPEAITLSPSTAHQAKACLSQWRQLGFDVEVRDERTISIHAIPQRLQGSAPTPLVQDILLPMAALSNDPEERILFAVAQLACHIAHTAPSTSDPNALLEALARAAPRGRCEHRHAIATFAPWSELSRHEVRPTPSS